VSLSPSPRRLLVVAAAALATVTLFGSVPSSAHYGHYPPPPTRIVIDAITSTVQPPAGTPAGAVPYVLVKVGEQFTIDVSFRDKYGALASFTRDTTLTVSTNTGPGNSPIPATGVAAKGRTTARLTTSLAAPANQVQVTVSATASGVTPGVSTPAQVFDVLAELRVEPSTANFRQGIGGADNCREATAAEPVCGVVILPRGAVSPQVLLSRGACDLAYGGCDPRGSVVQTLADLTGLYTTRSPATIVMRCDKTLCGGGAIHETKLMYSLKGNAALTAAKPCPTKGGLGSESACVDYRQSNREYSGDTVLYLLFKEDARVSVR